MKRISLSIVALVFILGACTSKSPQPVADLVRLPQDAGAYTTLAPHSPILAPETQAAAYDNFLAEHFGPWNRSEAKHTAEEVFWGLALYPKKELYGENTLLRSPKWIQNMHAASRVDEYPSMGRKAIAVINTSMRVLPTNEPAFYDFSRAGEGFPFDYMQNSLVLAGTPLFASHVSADGAWILVESRFAFGWVPASEIGWVDDKFATTFQTGTYGAVVQDDVPVKDAGNQYRFTGHIGTLLPIMEADPITDEYALLIPVRTTQGNAVLQVAFLPGTSIQKAPIPATPANLSRLANKMMNRPYGWGGLYEGRDCSAATMDLMAAFGIYLPRNSSQQIKVGTAASLDGMDSPAKKAFIVKTATPFMTLVRKPGHIMLYIGHKDGEPIVFHSTWGLKTKVGNSYGRKVIGKAVITTLEPGKELDDLAPGGLLIDSTYAISTLPEIGAPK